MLSSSELNAESTPRSPAKKSQPKSGTKSRSGRGTPQPPSWQRVVKRGAIFAPIFFATVLLLAGDSLKWQGAIVQTLFLLAVFVPFSYFMDRIMWRSQQKRLAKSRGA